ncbi:MAG: class I SAM-dependent methyltransferase [Proteobacteria bacterium]|nr:class I SAM-dependent methyltransferase [Pseudomonadota bacterium]
MEVKGLDKVKKISELGYIALRRPFIKRGKVTVQNEYENGWKAYSDILERMDSLESWLYLKGVEDQPLLCNVDGKISFAQVNMPEFNRNHLMKCIESNFKNITSITEFGSGLGRNLLYIKSRFPHIQCYGYELCENGVMIANRAKEKFGLDVQYSQLDFINDGSEKYIFPKTDIAFTMYALEQIPLKSDIAISHILSRVNMGSIHIEPVVENYPMTLRGVIGRIDHWKIDYLRNFETNLRKIPNITFSKQLIPTSHNPLMYPSIYCIKKMG